MPFGRVGAGVARSVLRSSPVGGLVSSVGGLFGKKPADRNASLRLRELGKRALKGDGAAIAQILTMAAEQKSKFSTINAAAVRWAQKLQANNLTGINGVSQSVGAGPIGIMAPGGGTTGATRRRARRRPAARRTIRRATRRTRSRTGRRRMSALQRKYFGRRRARR